MKKYLVIGNPIEHSLSPKLHNYWFKKNNIIAQYEKRKLSEKDFQNIIDDLRHGKISGIIYGATSKKIKNYLQIGNKFHINYNTKSENKAGYLKVEIDTVLTPNYFDNRIKLSCIISSMHLIKLLTVDYQTNTNIFNLIKNFFDILNSSTLYTPVLLYIKK